MVVVAGLPIMLCNPTSMLSLHKTSSFQMETNQFMPCLKWSRHFKGLRKTGSSTASAMFLISITRKSIIAWWSLIFLGYRTLNSRIPPCMKNSTYTSSIMHESIYTFSKYTCICPPLIRLLCVWVSICTYKYLLLSHPFLAAKRDE